MTEDQSYPLATRTCPTCQTAYLSHGTEAYLPFCSSRCQMIDLGRWFNEEISLPRVPDPDDEEAESEMFNYGEEVD